MLALKKVANQNEKFDIIFLDPPYESDFATKALNLIVELELLNENGIVIIETDDERVEATISCSNLNNKKIDIFDTRKYGKVMLIFIRRN